MSQQRRERKQSVEEQPQRDPAFLRKVIIGALILVAGLLSDVIYAALDPRVRVR